MRTNDLDARMEMDHVVLISPGGHISDGPADVYAPELFSSDADDDEYRSQAEAAGWTLESGWTGQHGYSGVIMHASEFIGGRLAEHVLCTPGLWVVTAATCDPECECDGTDECPEHEDDAEAHHDAEDHEAEETEDAGWVLAYRTHVLPSGVRDCPCCSDTHTASQWLCEPCQGAGCTQTHDASGDVGYWECERPNANDYDPYANGCQLCRRVGHDPAEPCLP
jgi:hypothetical protein